MRLALILVVLAVVAMLVASRIRAAARVSMHQEPLLVDETNREVTFTATVQPAPPNLDCVVVSGHSERAVSALFVSDSSDDALLSAIARLRPGRNAAGEAVELLVQWPGSGGRHSLTDILAEAYRPAFRLDFRLRREATREPPDSGCIVLVGPTVHGAVVPRATANSIADRLPRPGTPVVLTLKSRMEEA